VGARSVAGDDAESTATLATVIAKFEMAQGDHAVELGIREKALDALEADPGLLELRQRRSRSRLLWWSVSGGGRPGRRASSSRCPWATPPPRRGPWRSRRGPGPSNALWRANANDPRGKGVQTRGPSTSVQSNRSASAKTGDCAPSLCSALLAVLCPNTGHGKPARLIAYLVASLRGHCEPTHGVDCTDMTAVIALRPKTDHGGEILDQLERRIATRSTQIEDGTRRYHLAADDADVDAFDRMLYQIDTDWHRHVENWRAT
jgi:hypothetical protein